MRFFFFIFLFTSSYIFGQPVRSISYETMIETAEEALSTGDYLNAVKWYEEAYKLNKDSDVSLNIGQIYYLIRDYKKAEKRYRRVLNRDKTGTYKEDRFIYARSLKAQGKYQEAINEYKKFIEETEEEDLKQLAFLDLLGIQNLNEYEENISTVLTFMDKKINSGSADFAPAMDREGNFYFSSFMTKKETVLDGEEGDYHMKIYKAVTDEEGEYDDSEVLGSHINREGYHTSNPSFSMDGTKMYFTRSLLEGNDLIESKIFVSTKNGANWGAAEELSLNGAYLAKHPVEGELYGNKVIFFAANIDGGYGGFDIYYATIEGENQFATPVNLGETINTSEDELTPYFIDGTLYLSSDGHPGMGGYDLFYTSWDGNNWSQVRNLGYIYNSSYDDMYFRLSPDGTGGYIVSNRIDKAKRSLKSKTCCDDIYEFMIREIVIDLLAEVYDEEDKPINDAKLDLVDLTIGQDTTSKTSFNTHKLSFLLEGDHNYKAVITKDGYFNQEVTFNTMGILDDYTVSKKIVLKKEPEEPEIEIVMINQPIRLSNIYYDLDDDKILPDAEQDLSYLRELMDQYSDMVIELSSHTDAQGIGRYNRELSQRRAESAKSWLLERGVAESRIKPIGYGEKFIINHCVNNVKCTDDEHRVNRRTEFKILEGPKTIEIRKEILRKK